MISYAAGPPLTAKPASQNNDDDREGSKRLVYLTLEKWSEL